MAIRQARAGLCPKRRDDVLEYRLQPHVQRLHGSPGSPRVRSEDAELFNASSPRNTITETDTPASAHRACATSGSWSSEVRTHARSRFDLECPVAEESRATAGAKQPRGARTTIPHETRDRGELRGRIGGCPVPCSTRARNGHQRSAVVISVHQWPPPLYTSSEWPPPLGASFGESSLSYTPPRLTAAAAVRSLCRWISRCISRTAISVMTCCPCGAPLRDCERRE